MSGSPFQIAGAPPACACMACDRQGRGVAAANIDPQTGHMVRDTFLCHTCMRRLLREPCFVPQTIAKAKRLDVSLKGLFDAYAGLFAIGKANIDEVLNLKTGTFECVHRQVREAEEHGTH